MKASIIGVIFVMLIGVGYATSATKVPLPPDINITEPDPSLPEEIQTLVGRWEGRWEGQMQRVDIDTILIVEKVSTNDAIVIFANGYSSFVPRFEARWRRLKALVVSEGGKIIITLPHSQIEFFFSPKENPSILEGRRIVIQGIWYATLKRVK